MFKIFFVLFLLVQCIFGNDFDKAESLHEKGEYKLALSYYIQSCKNKNHNGCLIAARYFDRGYHGTTDGFKAFEFFKKSCDLGNNEACFRLSEFYENGKFVRQDLKKSFDILNVICDKGFGIACSELGYIYGRGQIVKKDIKKTFFYHKKACNNKYYLACKHVGSFYANKTFKNFDLLKALEYFRKACTYAKDNYESSVCLEIGGYYDNLYESVRSLNTISNDKIAKEFYGFACDKKNKEGCIAYKRLNSNQLE